ncbi:MAG: hypothetical protein IT158_23270 [Bryobacterales bacterium]|nr:hypothetical protein [Bryobacterales bacterium]
MSEQPVAESRDGEILRRILALRNQPPLRWTPAGLEVRLAGDWVRLEAARDAVRRAGLFRQLVDRRIPYGWLLVPDSQRAGLHREIRSAWKWAGRRHRDGAACYPSATPG